MPRSISRRLLQVLPSLVLTLIPPTAAAQVEPVRIGRIEHGFLHNQAIQTQINPLDVGRNVYDGFVPEDWAWNSIDFESNAPWNLVGRFGSSSARGETLSFMREVFPDLLGEVLALNPDQHYYSSAAWLEDLRGFWSEGIAYKGPAVWEGRTKLTVRDLFTGHAVETYPVLAGFDDEGATMLRVVRMDANVNLLTVLTWTPARSFALSNAETFKWIRDEVGSKDMAAARRNWEIRRDEILGAMASSYQFASAWTKRGVVTVVSLPLVSVVNLFKDLASAVQYITVASFLAAAVPVATLAASLAYAGDKLWVEFGMPLTQAIVASLAVPVYSTQWPAFGIDAGFKSLAHYGRPAAGGLSAVTAGSLASLIEGGRHVANAGVVAGEALWVGGSDLFYYGPRWAIYRTIHKYKTELPKAELIPFADALGRRLRARYGDRLDASPIDRKGARFVIDGEKIIVVYRSFGRVAVEVNYDNAYERARLEAGRGQGLTRRETLDAMQDENLEFLIAAAGPRAPLRP